MLRSAKKQTSLGRITAAIGVFVGALAIISFALSGVVRKNDPLTFPKEIKSSDRGGSQLFYQSIGRVSMGLRQPEDQKRKGSLADSYTLEIDSATSVQDAELFLGKLAKQGIQAYYTPLQKDGRVLYRIRSGIFQSKEIADRAANRLKYEHKINSKVNKLQ